MAPRSNPPRQARRRARDDDSSTSQRGIPSNTRLANIPKQAVDKASKSLRKIISPEDDDGEIQDALQVVWVCVQEVLEQDPNLKRHLASKEEFRDNVASKGPKNFFDSLRTMASNSVRQGSKAWEDLFEDEVFFKQMQVPDVGSSSKDTTRAQEATERAWERNFKGKAAEVLLQTISSYLDKGRDPYSRQAIIVNSSGTGKSRMVDQLATAIITVPMCLRSDPNTGYPPPDTDLRSWLLPGEISDNSLGMVESRLHGFVYALLAETRKALEAFESDGEGGKIPKTADDVKSRQAELAKAFRRCMSEGQSYQGTSDYRKGFYKRVIELAEKFIKANEQRNDTDTKEPDDSLREQTIEIAGEQLARFVDPGKILDSASGKPRRPLVIFSFDEAHTLTDNPSTKGRETKWNMFSELRRIFRLIADHAIFSLFLSTAGRFNLFSPEKGSDPSIRIQESKLSTLDLITEISFDDLAYPAPEDKVNLTRVVEMDWMCHLGRPLFASIYDAAGGKFKSKTVLMDFAKGKLLGGPSTLENDRSGSLACLAVRFALEFNMDGTAGDVARTQVERHMRLCLAATAGRDTLVTLAGSEPLLAEAAYEVLKVTQSNPVHHLANHPDLNCVDRGRRGELVASLLIMQACDAARAELSGQRWVPVNSFMKELLPDEKYDDLMKSMPNFYRGGEKVDFATTFKDYGIWFNHVIKVQKEKMYSAEHLWKFITRGAMMLCANNQQGVDIVIPICHTKKALSRDSVTAIFVQVKNAEKYQSNIDKTLFDRMDPIDLGLFPDNVVPKPVIRIVFALAAVEAGVHFPETRQRVHRYHDPFTAFDVWCAGLGIEAFKGIQGDLQSYKHLLERSLRPHDAFDLKDDPKISGKGHATTRDMRGTHRRKMAPLITEDEAHHVIHSESESAA